MSSPSLFQRIWSKVSGAPRPQKVRHEPVLVRPKPAPDLDVVPPLMRPVAESS